MSSSRFNVIFRPGYAGGTFGTSDALLTKVSVVGEIVYSTTVVGGAATGLALDGMGNVYLTGFP